MKNTTLRRGSELDCRARVRGLECGADGYLVKPFAFAELTARLRALVRRGAREAPLALTNGRVRIEPAARRVWNGEHEVELGPLQFELLELFLRHPGEVFSRSRLVSEVWDFAADPRSNVVDQHVGQLRRRMQADTCSRSPHIALIWARMFTPHSLAAAWPSSRLTSRPSFPL